MDRNLWCSHTINCKNGKIKVYFIMKVGLCVKYYLKLALHVVKFAYLNSTTCKRPIYCELFTGLLRKEVCIICTYRITVL